MTEGAQTLHIGDFEVPRIGFGTLYITAHLRENVSAGDLVLDSEDLSALWAGT